MSNRRYLSMVVGIASAAAISGAALAGAATPPAAAHKAGDEVKFCGPVVALVEDSCIGVTSGGKTYEITSIGPKPIVGSMIVGAGYVGDEVTICQQGVHLRSAMWKTVEICPLH